MRREEIEGLKDKQITCKICGSSFTFSTGEQQFYQDRCLAEPKRCPECRSRRRANLVPDQTQGVQDGN